jgi:hypothetical protein
MACAHLFSALARGGACGVERLSSICPLANSKKVHRTLPGVGELRARRAPVSGGSEPAHLKVVGDLLVGDRRVSLELKCSTAGSRRTPARAEKILQGGALMRRQVHDRSLLHAIPRTTSPARRKRNRPPRWIRGSFVMSAPEWPALILLAPLALSCGEVGAPEQVEASDGSTTEVLDSAQEVLAQCHTSSDCAQPVQHVCQQCFDGSMDCARAECVAGRCSGKPAGQGCPGPVTSPCLGKNCGDKCEQCSIVDSGCSPGMCTNRGACKAALPDCTPTVGFACSPSDARAVGDCGYFMGWGWDGSKCVAIVGCACDGSDCVTLLRDEFTCSVAFQTCSRDAGSSSD